MNNYFYVDTDDEITSVIGKIREEKAEEIFLVVPKRALIAQSLVNLRLLDKEAKKHKKKLVFVSPDVHIRKLAEKAGLAVKKYVAKPKEEKKEEALTLTPKPRKLEPWEEEAAKRELASVIKKDEGKETGIPGTKIAVGAFSRSENMVAKKAAEVIDLKRTQLRRKDISFGKKKIKPTPSPPQISTPLPALSVRKGPLLSKKEAFPREDVEKKAVDGKMDIGRKESTAEPKKDIKTTVSPFRVRKLEARDDPLMPLSKIENIERETANLTLKEKEKLRDLWMEQKGMVRGKYIQSSTSLDLASTSQDSGGEEKVLSESSGLFKTTHRRVGNSGKIVDLRSNSQTLSESSQAEFKAARSPVLPVLPGGEPTRQIGANQQKKVVLLPLINIKFFSFFVLIILLALAVIAGIIIPDAKVVVKPNVNKSDLAMNFWVSGEISQIDAGEHLIPGKPIHFKVTEEKVFPASGSREIKENAQGQATITNSTGEPLSLKQNALLTDASGKKFYTQAPALVPAAETASSNSNNNANTAAEGSATVTIKAEGNGKDYNLKEGATLTIPGLADGDFASGITVKVKKEITGGESRTVKTVTREDIEKAKDELLEKARGDSRGELEKNLDSDTARIVKPEALSVEDIAYTASKAEGEEADTFGANLTATFFTVSFSRQDLEELSKKIVEENSSAEGGNATLGDYSLIEAKPLENKMEISANLSYQKVDQLDAAEIRRQLVAKKRSEAEEFLRGNKDIAQFTLNLWPGWPARLPLLERRIKVEIQ